ncbi:hypothetical protein C9374_006455 [Naegleria lovaniensis]|uniref:CSC1/OSCA1-like 7TM region domain-containing protein n=1 Tax=Naegleria lovaniensis TaxID=51637 RepID=A0AA88GIA0_NAELO|nr:uncharacterized protein C9374_006455 [Naegleria lovaniensis]KAG2381466.1 hypothetical protein C9374_006455 [Naegleria lovaniensis]
MLNIYFTILQIWYLSSKLLQNESSSRREEHEYSQNKNVIITKKNDVTNHQQISTSAAQGDASQPALPISTPPATERSLFHDNCSYVEVKDIGKNTRSYWKLRGIFLYRIMMSLLEAPFQMMYTIVKKRKRLDSSSLPSTFKTSPFSQSEKDEKRVLRFYGRDVLTYLKFHQLLWWGLLILLLLYSVLLYPIHISQQNQLDPIQREKFTTNSTGLKVGANDQFLVISSINTVLKLPGVLVVHVLLTIFSVALWLFLMGFLFLHDPALKTFNYRGCDQEGVYGSFSPYLGCYAGCDFYLQAQNMALGCPHDETHFSQLVSPFTLEIHNIPKHFTNKALFKEAMQKIFSEYSRNVNAPKNTEIVSAYHVINYSQRDKLQTKFEKQLEHLEAYNWLMKKSEKRPKKLVFLEKKDDLEMRPPPSPSHHPLRNTTNSEDENSHKKRKFVQRVDAISYTKRKIIELYNQIMLIEDELDYSSNYPNRVNSPIVGSGIGYVVFASREAFKNALKYASVGGYIQAYKRKVRDENGEEIEYILTRSERNALPAVNTGHASEGKVRKVHMRAFSTKYEQPDINWNSLYDRYEQSWIKPVIIRMVIFILMLLILIFLTTPVTILSSVDALFTIPQIRAVIDQIVSFGGPMAAFFFQYLPSILLLLTSALIPVLIVFLTKFEKFKTYGEYKRTLLRRMTIFLWLNTFIFPTLVLTSLDGVTNFFTKPNNWSVVFSNLFMADNGSLFMNFILNKTLWGLTFTVIPLVALIMYLITTRCTSHFWKKKGFKAFHRNVKPKDKLKSAEGPALSLESQYATTFTVFVIMMTFSAFSPFILLVGFVYFTLRYIVDRFTIARNYSHRRVQHSLKKQTHYITSNAPTTGETAKYSESTTILTSHVSEVEMNIQNDIVRQPFGSIFGFKSDYVAHRRYMVTLVELLLVALILYTIYSMLFYASKLSQSAVFIFHITMMALLTAVLLLSCVVVNLVHKRIIKKRRQSKEKALSVHSHYANDFYSPKFYWDYKNMLNETVTNL